MGRKSRSKQRNRSPLALVAPADLDEAPLTGDGDLEALIEEIANGAHDEHLRLLADVINARLRVVAATESLKVLTRLDVGDRVRINHHARPLYLQGRTATVIAQESGKVVVKLDHPTGRFVTGEVRCPPLVLDQLPK
jgi:hypothetical protein